MPVTLTETGGAGTNEETNQNSGDKQEPGMKEMPALTPPPQNHLFYTEHAIPGARRQSNH